MHLSLQCNPQKRNKNFIDKLKSWERMRWSMTAKRQMWQEEQEGILVISATLHLW